MVARMSAFLARSIVELMHGCMCARAGINLSVTGYDRLTCVRVL